MAEPKISLVIRARNVERSIGRTLESALSQTLPEIELICVDNHSVDKTLDVIRGYMEQDTRITLIKHEKDLGPLASDIIGMKIARGEFVTFLDADDAMPADACEIMYRQAKVRACDIIHFPAEVIAKGPVESDRVVNTERFSRPYPAPLWGEEISRKSVLERKYGWNLWGKLFRRDICKKVAECVPSIYLAYADDMLVYTFLAYFAESYFGETDAKPCYQYYIGGGDTTIAFIALDDFRRSCSALRAKDILTQFFTSRNEFEEYKEYCYLIPQHLMNDLMYVWLKRLRLEDQREGFQFLCQEVDPKLIAGAVLDLDYIRTDLEIAMNQRDQEIADRDSRLRQKDVEIAALDGQLCQRDGVIQDLERELAQKNANIELCWENLEQQGKALKTVEAESAEKSAVIQRQNDILCVYREARQTVLEHAEYLAAQFETPRFKRAFKLEMLCYDYEKTGFVGRVKLLFQVFLRVLKMKKMDIRLPLYEEIGAELEQIKAVSQRAD